MEGRSRIDPLVRLSNLQKNLMGKDLRCMAIGVRLRFAKIILAAMS